MLPAFFPLLIGLPRVPLSNYFLELGVRNVKSLTNVQFLTGESKMQKKQQIQKLIIGVLGNVAQKR